MAQHNAQYARIAAEDNLKDAISEHVCALHIRDHDQAKQARVWVNKAKRQCREVGMNADTIESIANMQRQTSQSDLAWDDKLHDMRSTSKPYMTLQG